MKFTTLVHMLKAYDQQVFAWDRAHVSSCLLWLKERGGGNPGREMAGSDLVEFIFVFLQKMLRANEPKGLMLNIKNVVDEHYPGLLTICRYFYQINQTDALTEARSNRLEEDTGFRTDLSYILQICQAADIEVSLETMSLLMQMADYQRHQIFLAIRAANSRHKLTASVLNDLILIYCVKLEPTEYENLASHAESHLDTLDTPEHLLILIPYLYSQNFLLGAPSTDLLKLKERLDRNYTELATTFLFFRRYYPAQLEIIFNAEYFASEAYRRQCITFIQLVRNTGYRPKPHEIKLLARMDVRQRNYYLGEFKRNGNGDMHAVCQLMLPEQYAAALKMIESWSVIDTNNPMQVTRFFQLFFSMNYLADESTHLAIEYLQQTLEQQYPGLTEIMVYPEAYHFAEELLIHHEWRNQLSQILTGLRIHSVYTNTNDRLMLMNMHMAQLTAIQSRVNHFHRAKLDDVEWQKVLADNCDSGPIAALSLETEWTLETILNAVLWRTSTRFITQKPPLNEADRRIKERIDTEYADFVMLHVLCRDSKLSLDTERKIFAFALENHEQARILAGISEVLLQLHLPLSDDLVNALMDMPQAAQEMFGLRLQGFANKASISGIHLSAEAVTRLAKQIRRMAGNDLDSQCLMIYLHQNQEVVNDYSDLIACIKADTARLDAVNELIRYLYEFGVRLNDTEMSQLSVMSPMNIKMLCIAARRLSEDQQLTHSAITPLIGVMQQALSGEPVALTRILPYFALIHGNTDILVDDHSLIEKLTADDALLKQMDVICSSLRILRLQISSKDLSTILSMSAEQRERLAIHLQLIIENEALNHNLPLRYTKAIIHASIMFYAKNLQLAPISSVEKISKKETGEALSRIIIDDTVEYFVQRQPEEGFPSGSEGIVKKLYSDERATRPVMVCKKFHQYLAPSDERLQLQASASSLVYNEPAYVFTYNNSKRVVMHYVDGFSYEGFDATEIAEIPLINRLHMMRQVFRELLTLHQNHLSHGDILPANFQVSYPRPGREHLPDAISLHLIDFGRVNPAVIPSNLAMTERFKDRSYAIFTPEDDLVNMGQILQKTFPELYDNSALNRLSKTNPQDFELLYAIRKLADVLTKPDSSPSCHAAQIVNYLDGLAGHLPLGLNHSMVERLVTKHIERPKEEVRDLFLFTARMGEKAAHSTSEPPLETPKANKNNPKPQ